MDQAAPRSPVQFITIDEDYAGQRIDNFLTNKLKGLPKTRLYRLLRKGEIRVNKKRIDANYRLLAADEIRLPPMHLPTPGEKWGPSKRDMGLLENRILFEDKGLLIVNKPAGMPVHGGTGVNGGVVEALRAMYVKETALELVHRLDLGTSGCLVLAKKRSYLRELHELMRNGDVQKSYVALSRGHWLPHEYEVHAPLHKNHLSSGERVVRVDPQGKESHTSFKPLQAFSDATLVEARLHTGRTHQIRVHASIHQHQLAGDDKYGDKAFNKLMRDRGLKRMFLHAQHLKFTLASGQVVDITAPLDQDLENCLKTLS